MSRTLKRLLPTRYDYPVRVPVGTMQGLRAELLHVHCTMCVESTESPFTKLLLANSCGHLLSVYSPITSTVTRKGPYFRDLVPIGTFGTFSELGSLFVFRGPYFWCFRKIKLLN